MCSPIARQLSRVDHLCTKGLLDALQVRKKADPAKNLVKGWLSDWKDTPSVQAEPSYTHLSGKHTHCTMLGQKDRFLKEHLDPEF